MCSYFVAGGSPAVWSTHGLVFSVQQEQARCFQGLAYNSAFLSDFLRRGLAFSLLTWWVYMLALINSMTCRVSHCCTWILSLVRIRKKSTMK